MRFKAFPRWRPGWGMAANTRRFSGATEAGKLATHQPLLPFALLSPVFGDFLRRSVQPIVVGGQSDDFHGDNAADPRQKQVEDRRH
jgi:hypothetical protein